MRPTVEQINNELAKLKYLAPRIRQTSAFGDDNRAKIDAQIDILSNRRSLSGFEPDETCEEYEESDQDVYNAARDAEEWMQEGTLCEGLMLSASWAPLLPEGHPSRMEDGQTEFIIREEP